MLLAKPSRISEARQPGIMYPAMNEAPCRAYSGALNSRRRLFNSAPTRPWRRANCTVRACTHLSLSLLPCTGVAALSLTSVNASTTAVIVAATAIAVATATAGTTAIDAAATATAIDAVTATATARPVTREPPR